jgi:hypothetical protein
MIANNEPHPNALIAKLAPVSCIPFDPATPLSKKLGSLFLADATVLAKPIAADTPGIFQDVKNNILDDIWFDLT